MFPDTTHRDCLTPTVVRLLASGPARRGGPARGLPSPSPPPWSTALTCPISERLRALYKIPLTHDRARRHAPIWECGLHRGVRVASRGAARLEKQIRISGHADRSRRCTASGSCGGCARYGGVGELVYLSSAVVGDAWRATPRWPERRCGRLGSAAAQIRHSEVVVAPVPSLVGPTEIG
jgi:hypothetical protein